MHTDEVQFNYALWKYRSGGGLNGPPSIYYNQYTSGSIHGGTLFIQNLQDVHGPRKATWSKFSTTLSSNSTPLL